MMNKNTVLLCQIFEQCLEYAFFNELGLCINRIRRKIHKSSNCKTSGKGSRYLWNCSHIRNYVKFVQIRNSHYRNTLHAVQNSTWLSLVMNILLFKNTVHNWTLFRKLLWKSSLKIEHSKSMILHVILHLQVSNHLEETWM